MNPLPSRLPQVGTTIFTVMSRLAAEHGAINLSQGFPDFSPPPLLLERVAHHMASVNTGANQYPPMAGALPLREAIAAKLEACYGAQYDVESEITVTAGATQALYTAITACVRPGDEVIVFAPVYDSYLPAIELQGGTARVINLCPPAFRPDWSAVAAAINVRTRMIILNTPHNPTGTVWTADDMAQLAALVRNTDIVLLGDEVYEHIIFADGPTGGRHESLARYPELKERSFVVSSFGKTFHITGWKIAYCAAPTALMAEFRKAHQFIVFTVHHPSQLALADFLRADPGFAAGLAEFYRAKRDFFRQQLAGSRFELLPSDGTYFQLARYDKINDLPDREFARWLTIEKGVAVIPVSAFMPDGSDYGLIRFCFAKNEATLAAAGQKLRAV
ncbi:MAG: pyridoxal phosphate-dependent aminotransferase [Rhodocyclaceae bacterium]|nr:pyridoxal phosphate-dependent aminotransferase [Rhodocyclaceae bacterium]